MHAHTHARMRACRCNACIGRVELASSSARCTAAAGTATCVGTPIAPSPHLAPPAFTLRRPQVHVADAGRVQRHDAPAAHAVGARCAHARAVVAAPPGAPPRGRDGIVATDDVLAAPRRLPRTKVTTTHSPRFPLHIRVFTQARPPLCDECVVGAVASAADAHEATLEGVPSRHRRPVRRAHNGPEPPHLAIHRRSFVSERV